MTISVAGLTDHMNPQERFQAAVHVGTSAEVLRELARSMDRDVRGFALINPVLPDDVVEDVVVGGDLDDVLAVLSHRPLSPEVAVRAVEAVLAVPATGTAPEGSRRGFIVEYGIKHLMLRPDQIVPVLLLGVRSGFPSVELAIASRRVCPDEVRAEVFRVAGVPARVAACATALVRVLAGHDWERELSAQVLMAVLPRSRGDLRRRVLSQMAVSPDSSARHMAAELTLVAEDVSLLCRDAEEWVRAAAAGNVLASDEDRVFVALSC